MLTRAQARRQKKQAAAVDLVSRDRLTDEQIAVKLGIDRRTLSRWKRQPTFSQAVADATEERDRSRDASWYELEALIQSLLHPRSSARAKAGTRPRKPREAKAQAVPTRPTEPIPLPSAPLSTAHANRLQKQEEAARLTQAEELNDHQIAAALGVNRRTLTRWRNLSHVQALIKQLDEEQRTRQHDELEARVRAQAKAYVADMIARRGRFP